ncbi:MAG TPA: Uma2 family endonuclease [Urbifossiella sp.]|nr:Uma2 family endonuclease [Urbifossiella sp.]
MTAVPKAKLTVAEYLAIERRAEFKSEFYDGEMFAMAGASREHNTVNENLSVRIGGQLLGGPCRTYSRDLRVRIERTGLYCYPDLVIVCGEPRMAEEDKDTLTNPRVVVEVLSPSTERYDRTTKFRHYKQLPSVEEYVLVAQDEAWCERYSRQADGSWAHVEFVGLDATLELKSVPVAVPLADVYAGVTFPPPEPPPAGVMR